MAKRPGVDPSGMPLVRLLIALWAVMLVPAVPLVWYDYGTGTGLILAAAFLVVLAVSLAATARRR